MRLSRTEYVTIAIGLIVIGIASRFLPHPPSATAITAIALVGTAYLGPRVAVLLVAAALLLSDIFIGSYELPVMLAVYGSFLIVPLFARLPWFQSRAVSRTVPAIGFFLITNAVLWYSTPWYPKDLNGLMLAYTLGLPFLANMLVADLLYTPALFGLVSLYRRIRVSVVSAVYAR